MIQISHQTAKEYIQKDLDGQLNPEQWNALQNHLEDCPECATYRRSTARLEGGLRYSLRSRWSGVASSSHGIAPAIIARQRRHEMLQEQLARAGLGLGILCFLLFVALSASPAARSGFVRKPEAAYKTAPPAAAPTQPALPPRFPGVVAFETSIAGNQEIFLVNSGMELLNLSSHPARDSSPAWSPDGQRLAFLSERSGKAEIFLVSLVDLGLVQVTGEPGIDWQGPLTWSQDGRWITLAGRKAGVDALYLVEPGSAGRQAEITRIEPGKEPFGGALTPGRRLASVFYQGEKRSVVTLPVGKNRTSFLSLPAAVKFPVVERKSLMWERAGGSFYEFILSGAAAGPGAAVCMELLVRQKPEILLETANAPAANRASAQPTARGNSSPPPAWADRGRFVFLEDYGQASCPNPIECGNQPRLEGLLLYFIPDLCVQSWVDQNSWTKDEGWLVVNAREKTGGRTGLYAVRMAQPGADVGHIRAGDPPTGTVIKLVDIAGAPSQPQVRP